MLAPDFGGLRPWEMDRLTPDEERALYARLNELERQAQEVS